MCSWKWHIWIYDGMTRDSNECGCSCSEWPQIRGTVCSRYCLSITLDYRILIKCCQLKSRMMTSLAAMVMTVWIEEDAYTNVQIFTLQAVLTSRACCTTLRVEVSKGDTSSRSSNRINLSTQLSSTKQVTCHSGFMFLICFRFQHETSIACLNAPLCIELNGLCDSLWWELIIEEVWFKLGFQCIPCLILCY